MIRAGEPELQGTLCFWPLGARAAWQKQEPELLQKKSGAGAEAAKNMRLLENKKKRHKEIVHLLLFFKKIVNFLWLKKIIFYAIYFLQFYIWVCGKKNILLNLTNSQEPHVLAA